MKVQMKFQKILTLVSLVVAALTFVFSISFLSGGLYNIQMYRTEALEEIIQGVDTFFATCQTFVGNLITMSIMFICSVLLLMITSTNTRRKYYITNYIALAIFGIMGLVVALYILISLFTIISQYNSLDWDDLMRAYTEYQYLDPTKDYTTIILGFVLVFIVLADLAVWALNFVWKLKLMKGEKALLEQGLVKEVA